MLSHVFIYNFLLWIVLVVVLQAIVLSVCISFILLFVLSFYVPPGVVVLPGCYQYIFPRSGPLLFFKAFSLAFPEKLFYPVPLHIIFLCPGPAIPCAASFSGILYQIFHLSTCTKTECYICAIFHLEILLQ